MSNAIQDEEALKTLTTPLTEDERYVLTQYINITQAAEQSPEQYQQAINNIISQSLGSSSQLMTFELTQ